MSRRTGFTVKERVSTLTRVLVCRRHVGDLGNVDEQNGEVTQTLTDDVISLVSSNNGFIQGRAVVVSSQLAQLPEGASRGGGLLR